ncbi:hypothetical protein E6H15_04140 [Candidatus Bathyarchaeota archaeon]|nr:MAG: hypothetical protein E6H15_04140 [Candidatus Bathyarchaeota archaeon]
MADTSSPGLARSPGYERPAENASGEDRRVGDEKAFASLLTDTVVESMADILGENVLSLLISKGMLDHAENPGELERQLSLTFGNGSVVLERMIVKALYRKLGIRADSSFGFDYAKALDVARSVFGETRRKWKNVLD